MPELTTDSAPFRLRAATGLLMFALVVGVAWFAARHFGLFEYAEAHRLRGLIAQTRGSRWAAPLFVLTYVVVSSIGLPATPMTIAGGGLFGVVAGSGLNWLGATLGATGAFFVARALGRDAVRRLLGGRTAALDRLTDAGTFTSLVRLRLIPGIPFNGLNFGTGLAGVKPGAFVLSTAVGIIPGTIIHTYFADALLNGIAGAREAAFVQIAIAGTLLIALSFVPRIARRFGWLAAAVLIGWGPFAMMTPARAMSQNSARADAAPYNAMLAQYVSNGLVDYDAFARDPRFLQFLRQLDHTDPSKLAPTDRLAFWINTYNAYTIQLINSRGERRSIRNINKRFGFSLKSPWAEPVVRAGGQVLTLDDVEHRIIRPQFKDPRVHVALVCAALGCPPLRSEAYDGARINEQLDDQARRFLGQHGKNRVDVASRTVFGSPIFTWYREDFGGSLAGVGAFWARFLPSGADRDLVLGGAFAWKDTDYDWSLNRRP
jgi:uncharacterized membrane protein YdjX (TVP38/TMEM64 family)